MKMIKVLLIIIVVLSTACNVKKAELGTAKNPIKMYFVPSVEAGTIVTNGRAIADHLEKVTGYHFKIAVPTSYAAVIEALGTKETDIAWLATFAYILANQKYGAEVALTTIRHGLKKYRGQFIARADSDIKSIKDIEGKVIAYSDAASTSGYIYPSAVLAKEHIKPSNQFFAGGHPQTILAVLKGRADVGCSYWSPKSKNGEIRDARQQLLDTYPTVEKETRVIGYTDWIPNDTVTFRKGFPSEMKEEIVQSLLDYVHTPEGKKTLKDLFNIDDFYRSNDHDYDMVREALQALDLDVSTVIE